MVSTNEEAVGANEGLSWGCAFRQWKEAAPRVRALVWRGLGLLVLATVVIGYGNILAT